MSGCIYGSSWQKTLGVPFRQDQTRIRSNLQTKSWNSLRRDNNPCPSFALLQHGKNKKIERGAPHSYKSKFYYRYYDLYDCKHRKCARNVISGVDAFVFVRRISAENMAAKRIVRWSVSQQDKKMFLCPLISLPSCSLKLLDFYVTYMPDL